MKFDDKIFKFCNNIIIILTIIFLILILISSITSEYRMYYESINNENHHLYSVIITMISIPFSIIVYYLLNKIITLKSKKIVISILIFSLFIFILGVVYFYLNLNQGKPYSDPFNIYDAAKSLYETNKLTPSQIRYIEIYPLNLPAIFYEKTIFELFNTTDIQFVSYINAFFFLTICLAIIGFSYFKIKKNGLTVFLTIGLLLSIPNMAYSTFYYTDILGTILFLGVCLILFHMYYNNKNSLKYYIILAVIIGIGASLRGNLLILGIAISIVAFLYNNKFYKFISIIILILVFLIKGQVINTIGNEYNVDTKSYAFPSTHWINMGQSTESKGNYLRSDRDNMEKLVREKGVEEASSFAKQSIIERVSSRNLFENFSFYMDKLNNAWNEGSNAIYHNGIFSMPISSNSPDFDPVYHKMQSKIIYIGLDIIQRSLYIVGVISLCLYYRRSNKDNYIITSILLTFIGTVIFYLMWESRARYTYSIMPLLIIALGIIIDENHRNKTSKKNNIV